jgi:hypothetical protein
MRRTLPESLTAEPASTPATRSGNPLSQLARTLRFPIGIGLASVALLAACSGDDPVAAPTPTVPEVIVEAARVGTGTIGVDGGTLSATGGTGVVYRLVVPRGALQTPTDLTITPVSALNNSPVGVGLSAAVRLAPAGLRFAVPARLEIVVTPVVAAGSEAVAFQSASDGTNLALRTASAAGAALTLNVAHFSIYGVSVLTPREIARLPRPPQTDVEGNALDAIARAPSASLGDLATVFRGWWAASVRPGLAIVATDSALTFALSDYTHWRGQLALTDASRGFNGALLTALVPQRDSADQAAAGGLRLGVSRGNLRCLASRNRADAQFALYWQSISELFLLATVPNALDAPTVQAGLCVVVELRSSSLRSTIVPGDTATLSGRFGARFSDEAALSDAVFNVTVAPLGAAGNVPLFRVSDAAGNFAVAFTRSSIPGPLAIAAQACLRIVNASTNICGTNGVTPIFGALGGIWTGSFISSVVTSPIPVTAVLVQVGDTLTGSYVVRSGNSISGTVRATVVNGTAVDFRLQQTSAICLGLFSGRATVVGNVLTATYTGSDCQGPHTNGRVVLQRR